MAKIVKFPLNTNNFEDFLQESFRYLLEIGAYNCVLAAKCKDGTVLTSYYNCDFGDRQELIGHLQYDIIHHVVKLALEEVID